jgi:hypothetical protein
MPDHSDQPLRAAVWRDFVIISGVISTPGSAWVRSGSASVAIRPRRIHELLEHFERVRLSDGALQIGLKLGPLRRRGRKRGRPAQIDTALCLATGERP